MHECQLLQVLLFEITTKETFNYAAFI